MGTKLRFVAVGVVGAAFLAGCLTPADISAQSDLRAGLSAENQVRTTATGQYTDSYAALKKIAPSLDWGGKLTGVVGDAMNAGDNAVVCLQERSTSGITWSIAQVAIGPNAGVYTGKLACPAAPTAANVMALGQTWQP